MVREQKCRWVFDGFFMDILQWVRAANPSNGLMTRWFGFLGTSPNSSEKSTELQRTETAFSLNKGALKYDNAVKTKINHSFGTGVYHPFMVILGMVYYCLKHIRILHKSGQHTTRLSRSMNIQSSCAARHPQEDLLHPAPTPAWSRFAILGWQVDQKVPVHITGWFVTNEKNISHKLNVYKCYTFMVREA